jgi:hypothetical protein
MAGGCGIFNSWVFLVKKISSNKISVLRLEIILN